MEQHGDIPGCPRLKYIRWTGPSGHRWLGISGCLSCRGEPRSLIAMVVNTVVSDVETSVGIANAYEDGSFEWRVDWGRGDVGGNGE